MSPCDHRLHIHHSSWAGWPRWPVTPSESCFHISSHLWFLFMFQVPLQYASGYYERSKQPETENTLLLNATHLFQGQKKQTHLSLQASFQSSPFWLNIHLFPLSLLHEKPFQQGKLQLLLVAIASIPDGDNSKFRCHMSRCVSCSLGRQWQEGDGWMCDCGWNCSSKWLSWKEVQL